ncbi:MAG TPA: hypothetical protein VJ936_09145 [Desulfobacteraceae bacterium]|nr:hypothetical protein [Desulfobacteraceae bacterium]
MIKRVKFLLENWLMVVHLLFKTTHLGVNNRVWSSHPSVFGQRGVKGFTQVIKNYKMMKIRAFSGFIPLNDAIDIFPGHAEKHGYKPIDTSPSKGQHHGA